MSRVRIELLLARRQRQEESLVAQRIQAATPPRTWAVYEVPPCFDSMARWVLWRESARDPLSRTNPDLPCVDCWAPYQAEMIAAGLCANPSFTTPQSARSPQRGENSSVPSVSSVVQNTHPR